MKASIRGKGKTQSEIRVIVSHKRPFYSFISYALTLSPLCPRLVEPRHLRRAQRHLERAQVLRPLRAMAEMAPVQSYPYRSNLAWCREPSW